MGCFKYTHEEVTVDYDIESSIDYSIVKKSASYDIYKRSMDIIIAICGVLIGLPLIIVIGLLIKLEDKGPVFYKQERFGKGCRQFYIYKIRSMVLDAEKLGAQWAIKDDPRITKVGRFIRRTRIDEIPQLINVLKGDMSIIGPRPERPIFTYEFSKEIMGFANRLVIKPGITGWAQVNGGYEVTPREKYEKDIYYIKNRSVFLDISIIIKTIKIVITGEGSR